MAWRIQRGSAKSCVMVLLAGASALYAAEFPGITAAIRDATVSSQTAGEIASIPVKEGQAVKKGDLLVELESQIEKLEAARRKLIWESRAELNSASNRVVKASNDVERARLLLKTTQSVSQEELEKDELEYATAAAEFERLLTAESREEIEYKMAMEQVRQHQITAPIDGTVAKIYLEQGENCEPSQPLVRIVDTDACRFTANVDAAVAARIKVGDDVMVKVEAPDFAACPGKIAFISSVVDPASDLLEVKAEFANPQGIPPGLAGTLVTHD